MKPLRHLRVEALNSRLRMFWLVQMGVPVSLVYGGGHEAKTKTG